jgi:hypothetical protein
MPVSKDVRQDIRLLVEEIRAAAGMSQPDARGCDRPLYRSICHNTAISMPS